MIGRYMCQRNESCVVTGPGLKAASFVANMGAYGRQDERGSESVTGIKYGRTESTLADVATGDRAIATDRSEISECSDRSFCRAVSRRVKRKLRP